MTRASGLRVFAASLALAPLAACASGATSPDEGNNRAPRINAVVVSPQGMGLQSATTFTFTGQGVSDPDGDALTYVWTSSDGRPIASTAATAVHTYTQSGTFQMRLTITDSGGRSTSATASVSVGTVTGTWDLTCTRTPYATQSCVGFPSQFVVSLSQSGTELYGSLSGGGRTRAFTYPGWVADSRIVRFGVESFDNVFCGPNWDSDMYFTLAANNSLNAMSMPSGTPQTGGLYCSSYTATRR